MVLRSPAFSSPGRFYRGNLHTHSTTSDGALEPAEVCRRYSAEGYDFICISDHFIGLFDYPITDTSAYRTESFTTILGAEMHTSQMKNGEIWHILAVGLPTDFTPPETPNLDGAQAPESAASLARRCAEAGAFVALAHPQWNAMTLEDARPISSAHAVEIYNHSAAVEGERGDGFAILDLLLAEGRTLSACATDDAHFRQDPDHFGGWVMVKAEAREPGALLAALKAGHYYSSQGPRLHDIRIEDNTIHVECTPADRILVVGAGSANKRVYGAGMASASFPLARFQSGGWVRVVIVDRHGRRAWSNPIRFG